MNRPIAIWIAGLLVLVGGGILAIGSEDPTVPSLITGVDELVGYPALSAETLATLFVVVLPETDRAVLLRPIDEAEFASYQVQAIAAEMIDYQMLAAAFVIPVLTTGDAAALPIELARYLMERVNRISGFAVFDDVAVPEP
jgi:hypothetical protein